MPKNHIPLSPQCADILTELASGPRTTLQLHRSCGILAVNARIHELRSIGYAIDTQLIGVSNRHKQRCHVALYTLRRRRGRPAKVKAKVRRA